MKNVVPFRVAEFLEKRFNFNENTLYIYDSREELHFSLEPGLIKKTLAPDIYQAIEFLWMMGLKIYYVPISQTEYCKGVIETNKNKIIMNSMFDTPQNALLDCLLYISNLV